MGEAEGGAPADSVAVGLRLILELTLRLTAKAVALGVAVPVVRPNANRDSLPPTSSTPLPLRLSLGEKKAFWSV